MPATGTPVPKGISYQDAIKIITKISISKNILGFDFVEFSPIKKIKTYNFISACLVYDIMGIIESDL